MKEQTKTQKYMLRISWAIITAAYIAMCAFWFTRADATPVPQTEKSPLITELLTLNNAHVYIHIICGEPVYMFTLKYTDKGIKITRGEVVNEEARAAVLKLLHSGFENVVAVPIHERIECNQTGV